MHQAGARASEGFRILEALKQGDEDAFARLIEDYTPGMLRAATAITGDPTMAEEAVQDAWLAVLQGLDSFEGRSSLKTWIFAILLNRARTRAARERRMLPLSSLTEPGPPERSVASDRFEPLDHPRYPRWWREYPSSWAEVPEERLVAAELRGVVEETLADLPVRQRVVITLRDLLGCTPQEVCSILDIRETNQRVLLHRARSRVRQVLERYFDEGRER